ncbi:MULTISPECIES: hypothetical protein [Kineosporia]|nr:MULTISPECIES: hypothetical protein [Kineosporia]
MAMIRDETTMDDGRRITYYYGSPASVPADAAAAVEQDGEEQ